jgi:hypothetical protein
MVSGWVAEVQRSHMRLQAAHAGQSCVCPAPPPSTLCRCRCVCWPPQEPGPGQFRFPHFYLIGFQKCATTSLFQ